MCRPIRLAAPRHSLVILGCSLVYSWLLDGMVLLVSSYIPGYTYAALANSMLLHARLGYSKQRQLLVLNLVSLVIRHIQLDSPNRMIVDCVFGVSRRTQLLRLKHVVVAPSFLGCLTRTKYGE